MTLLLDIFKKTFGKAHVMQTEDHVLRRNIFVVYCHNHLSGNFMYLAIFSCRTVIVHQNNCFEVCFHQLFALFQHAILETGQLWVASSFGTILAEHFFLSFCHCGFCQSKHEQNRTNVEEVCVFWIKTLCNKHWKQERIKHNWVCLQFRLEFKDNSKPFAFTLA